MVDAPIVVVGAGPVGLLLAGELSLGGAEVVVLERRDRPATESRASTLHARSMEILDSRGLLAQFGAPPREPMGHFGGIPLDLSLPGPFPGQWKIPQTRVEEVLSGWALGRGATVRRGWTVTAVTDTGDQVEVVADTARGRQVVRAAYVVACDGQDSTVRALTGMPFPGVPARHTMLRADVVGIEVPARRFQRLPQGMAVAARNPAGVTRIMVHEFGGPVPGDGATPGFAAVAGAWRRVTGEDISAGEPRWLNAFDDANRQVDRYRAGRVLFAGDAAHVQLPAGGQALNLGLQDAANLGWKLAGVVRGDTGPGLLDTYHDERHAVGRRVLANIRAQAELLLGDDSVEPVRALLGELLTREHNRALLAGVISGTGLRYPPGPGDHPAVGSRIPGLDLRDGRGLLAGAGGRAYAGAWLDRVAVSGTKCPVPGAATALIRPDGHVAWAGSDPAAARAALTRWFGPARDRALTTTNGRKDLS